MQLLRQISVLSQGLIPVLRCLFESSHISTEGQISSFFESIFSILVFITHYVLCIVHVVFCTQNMNMILANHVSADFSLRRISIHHPETVFSTWGTGEVLICNDRSVLFLSDSRVIIIRPDTFLNEFSKLYRKSTVVQYFR